MAEGSDESLSHADVGPLVRAYARGTLTGRGEALVRRHLASGCADCLGALFALPVGLPREHVDGESARRGDAWRVAGLVAGVVALMGTMLVSGWWMERGPGRMAAASGGGFPARALEQRAALTGRRVRALGRRAGALERKLWGLAPWTAAGGQGPLPGHGGLAAQTDALALRAFGRFGAALVRPATRLTPLRPTAVAGHARGWALLDPITARVFVYVTGIPSGVGTWRVRIAAAGDVRERWLRPLGDGGFWAEIDWCTPAGGRATIAIVAPDDGRVLLRARDTIGGRAPAA